MILELSIKNFRSIKNDFTFSLLAEQGRSKPENTFEVELVNGQKCRLLKSAVLYGPNASGKSNFIRALFNLTRFIKESLDLRVETAIPYYEPFLFDEDTETAPCELSIDFLLPEGGIFVKYRYLLSYTRQEVLKEELDYFPKGQKQNLFKRFAGEAAANIHTAKLSKNLGYKEYDLFKNQLMLSKFGKDIPHELLTKVYLFFDSVEVWNALDVIRLGVLREQVTDQLLLPKNAHLLKRINKLVRIADMKINGLAIKPGQDAQYTPDRNRVSAEHSLYKNGIQTGVRQLPLLQESAGTNILFALGGIILKKLETGGVLFFDELDNSLHPKLSKFLVRLFNNPVSNPKNSQLVVATHEVTLLDKEVFRKDQIWFAEKDRSGATDIFSAKDFEGVRDDTPFDRWYMNGKFGGQPNIKEIEFIFDHA